MAISVNTNKADARPAKGRPAKVYVPREGQESLVAQSIAPGSGIVGYPLDATHAVAGDPLLMLYYEGNLFHAANMCGLVDKVRQAYGRMVQRYPTVACMAMPRALLECVGTTDGDLVQIDNSQALSRWLEWSGVPESAPTSPEERLPARPSARGRFR